MPLFLIERTFADLVPTDAESMAAIKLFLPGHSAG